MHYPEISDSEGNTYLIPEFGGRDVVPSGFDPMNLSEWSAHFSDLGSRCEDKLGVQLASMKDLALLIDVLNEGQGDSEVMSSLRRNLNEWYSDGAGVPYPLVTSTRLFYIEPVKPGPGQVTKELSAIVLQNVNQESWALGTSEFRFQAESERGIYSRNEELQRLLDHHHNFLEKFMQVMLCTEKSLGEIRNTFGKFMAVLQGNYSDDYENEPRLEVRVPVLEGGLSSIHGNNPGWLCGLSYLFDHSEGGNGERIIMHADLPQNQKGSAVGIRYKR